MRVQRLPTVIGLRAPVRFGLALAPSIVGLLLIASPSLGSTYVWDRPGRAALAETTTATSTLPSPEASPAIIFLSPTLAEPPLAVQGRPSVSSVSVGQEFSYLLQVFSSSPSTRSIDVRVDIDGPAEVIGTSASSGSCTVGQAVTCQIGAQRGQPALVTIDLRALAAAPGSLILYEALAQDDMNNTASSDQSVVTIIPSATVLPTVTPTATPAALPERPTVAPDLPSRPTVAQAPSSDGASDSADQPPSDSPSPTIQATAAADVAASAAITPTADAMSANVAESASSPTTSPLASDAPTALSVAPPLPEPLKTAELPTTSSTTSAVGVAGGLLGLALMLRGVRRVRRASAQLAQEGAALPRLRSLLSAIARLQRHTTTGLADMQDRSRLMAGTLRRVEENTDRRTED